MDESEDMDLGEIDLDEIEREGYKKRNRFIPSRYIELLKEYILETKSTPNIGVANEPHKAIKMK